jgi:hypothetical protein
VSERIERGPAGPGWSPDRLARLATEAVRDLELDLGGTTVLTEAATGAYVVTPVLAAMAGADHVHAVTRATRYGTVADVEAQTSALASLLGVEDQIAISVDAGPDLFAMADVVTNSAHLRPIDGERVAAMPPGAVLSLMFEAWEIEAGRHDVDLGAVTEAGIAVAGTNERHPDIDVFGYLGLMTVLQLADAGVAAYRAEVAVLCDNAFAPSLEQGLTGAGARCRIAATLDELLDEPIPDALVVAMRPTGTPVLAPGQVNRLAEAWPGTMVTQFWGDLDREAMHAVGVPVWPACAPSTGHMGVLPSRVGPEPVVRLQAGGLKVAEILRVPADRRTPRQWEYLDEL